MSLPLHFNDDSGKSTEQQNRTPWNHSPCRNGYNDIHIVLKLMRFIYLTLPNLHTNTCDLHSRAGTKMLARSTRLPPYPNKKRESGDETTIAVIISIKYFALQLNIIV